MLLYTAFIIHLLLATSVKASLSEVVSVTYTGTDYKLHDGTLKNWVARANYTDNTFIDGWAYLEVETNPIFPDAVQAFAAGYAEGFISADMIYNSYRNNVERYCNWTSESYCKRLHEFIVENTAWIKSMIPLKAAECPVFHNIELILAQIQGISSGYEQSGQKSIGQEAIMLLNLFGDLFDLELALNPKLKNMTIEDFVNSRKSLRSGHCSALIKVLPGNVDLFASHASWNWYRTMLRIQKKYIFPFRRTGSSGPHDINPGHTVSFSSYPGILMSGDDFHIISSGLVSIETTIDNHNPALYANVSAKGQIPCFMRSIVANRVAVDGKSWTDFFSMHNSGTYNNQWMVLDYKLFKRGKKIKPNTLWILEQMPGFVVANDQSHLLRNQRYWASYNRPFYKSIFDLAGWPAMVAKYGDWFSYDKTPRALIFKRDHSSARNIDSMIKLMRYNDYIHDPLSACNCTPPYSAMSAISGRGDLNPKNGSYPFELLGHLALGGIDVKMTTFGMAKKHRFLAINGPTSDQQPIFKWSEQDFVDDVPHYGHPDSFNFPVTGHKWKW